MYYDKAIQSASCVHKDNLHRYEKATSEVLNAPGVTGTVTCDGEPTKAKISITSHSLSEKYDTNPAGSFEAQLDAGVYTVKASPVGDSKCMRKWSPSKKVTVKGNQLTVVDFQLNLLPVIKGTVTCGTNPVDAEIRIMRRNKHLDSISVSRTNNGRFSGSLQLGKYKIQVTPVGPSNCETSAWKKIFVKIGENYLGDLEFPLRTKRCQEKLIGTWKFEDNNPVRTIGSKFWITKMSGNKQQRQRLVCQEAPQSSPPEWKLVRKSSGNPCPKLDKPTNGEVVLTGLTLGKKAAYSCDLNFKLDGNQERTCQNGGSWSGTEPSCVKVVNDDDAGGDEFDYYGDCKDAILPPHHGKVHQTSKTPGSIAKYSCDANFKLEGSKERKCENGLWTGSQPQCVGDSDDDQMQWDTYQDPTKMKEFLQNLKDHCGNRFSFETIGKSAGYKDIFVVEMTDDVNQVDNDKPQFLWTGNIHGNEAAGGQLILRFLHKLCHDPTTEMSSILAKTRVLFIPSLNPDGFQKAFVRNGNFAVPDHLLDRDWAYGRNNNRDCDINRNFPSWPDFKAPHECTPQPETKAYINFVKSRRIVLSGTFHGGFLIANYPLDSNTSAQSLPNLELIKSAATAYSSKHDDMRKVKSLVNEDGVTRITTENGAVRGALWYIIKGGLQDYVYKMHQQLDVTFEIGYTKYPAARDLPGIYDVNLPAMMNYMKVAQWGVHGTVKCRGVAVDATVTIKPAASRDDSKILQTDTESKAPGHFRRLLINGQYDIQVVPTMESNCEASGWERMAVNNADGTTLKHDFDLQERQGLPGVMGTVTCDGKRIEAEIWISSKRGPARGKKYVTNSAKQSTFEAQLTAGVYSVRARPRDRQSKCMRKRSPSIEVTVVNKLVYLNIRLNLIPVITGTVQCARRCDTEIRIKDEKGPILNISVSRNDPGRFSESLRLGTYSIQVAPTGVCYCETSAWTKISVKVGENDLGNLNFPLRTNTCPEKFLGSWTFELNNPIRAVDSKVWISRMSGNNGQMDRLYVECKKDPYRLPDWKACESSGN